MGDTSLYIIYTYILRIKKVRDKKVFGVGRRS